MSNPVLAYDYDPFLRPMEAYKIGPFREGGSVRKDAGTPPKNPPNTARIIAMDDAIETRLLSFLKTRMSTEDVALAQSILDGADVPDMPKTAMDAAIRNSAVNRMTSAQRAHYEKRFPNANRMHR